MQKGKVKWFNETKGYGFITLDNGGDAFCHASALQAAGHSDVQPGTTIICDLADSPRGMQVVTVHSVDTSTAEAPSRGPRRDGFGGGFGGGGFGGGHHHRAFGRVAHGVEAIIAFIFFVFTFIPINKGASVIAIRQFVIVAFK